MATKTVITNPEREELTWLARSRLGSVRLTLRARIVLLATDGLENQQGFVKSQFQNVIGQVVGIHGQRSGCSYPVLRLSAIVDIGSVMPECSH